MKYASKILDQARAWIGCKESDGSHKKIIDIYNGHSPRARGYKMRYTDSWCATFVSAVAIACGYTDIIPTECGCQKMIELFKKLGCWEEADDYVPAPGDVCFYDWDDSGKGDCTGWSDHVGYVEKVEEDTITLIEGNRSNRVKRCTIAVNGRYIRGYGVPKYDVEPSDVPATAPAEPEYIIHTVVKGNSLWAISRKYLGNGNRYKEIMKLNGLTTTTIHVGQKLKIPEK